jgi:addiction module HigA family antidote
MLLEEFLIPMGLSQRELAVAIHVPYQRINEIVNGHRGMTSSTALRLAKFFGISASFWMHLQLRWDLYHTQQTEEEVLETIQPYPPICNNPKFRQLIETADQRIKETGGLTHEEFWRSVKETETTSP